MASPADHRHVQIGLFGHFRITSGGETFRFSAPPRTVPLLAYLAIHRSKPMPRETVAFTLWPDVDEEIARANLRRHLHYMVRALPPAMQLWTIGDKRVIRWNVDGPAEFDIAEFERLCSSAEGRLRAVDLYAGDLLEGFDEEWLCYERERLRSMQLSSLELLIAESAAAADAARTIFFARRLLQLDPWREDALRGLIVARSRMGDRAGAMADYHRFAATLAAELNVEPMPETVACFQAIAADTPPAPVDLSIPRRRPSQLETLPLAGRAQEFERLRILWSRASRGRGSCALIGGEAGTGKTRLTQELAAEAQRDGIVAIGYSVVAEPMPYYALADAARMVPLEGLRIDAPWLAALERVVPDLRAAQPASPRTPALDAEAERARLLEAFARLFGAAARRKPLLLVLEDLHWSGAALMAAIEYLARRVAHLPMLVIGTYREEEVGVAHPLRNLRRRLAGSASFDHIALSNLNQETVEMLIGLVSGGGQETNAFARQLFAISDGNPLFLVEALRDAVEAKRVVIEGGRWNVLGTIDSGVPRAVKATIADRLGRLSSRAYAFAEIGAVIGRGFNLELVNEVSAWSEGDAIDALDELLDRQILRDSGGRTGAHYAFSHHLIATTVYEAGEPAQLIQRHRRTAAVLERLAGDEIDEAAAEIARHWRNANEPARAASFFARAARHALGVAGNQEAFELASLGLESTQDEALRIDLLRVRQEAARRELRREEQRRDLDEMWSLAAHFVDRRVACAVLALRIAFFDDCQEQDRRDAETAALEREATALADARWQAEAGLSRAELDVLFGRYDAARTQLARVAALEPQLMETDVPVRLALAETRIDFWQGRLADGDAAIERSKRLVRDADHALRVRILYAEIDAARFSVDWERQRRAARELIDICDRVGDRPGSAYGHGFYGSACTELYDADEGGRHLELAATLYDELGRTRWRVMILEAFSAWESLYGTLEGTIAYAAQCEDLALTISYDLGAAIGSVNLASALCMIGRFAEAKPVALRAIEYGTRINNRFVLGPAYAVLGFSERGLGNLVAAVEDCERGIAISREIPTIETIGDDISELVTTYALVGSLERLPSLAAEALRLRADYAHRLTRSQSLVWAAAKAYRALGDLAAARELLAQARQAVDEQSARISSDRARRAYRDSWQNAQILRAAQSDVWPFPERDEPPTTMSGFLARKR